MLAESVGSPALWTGFAGLVALFLALDLGVFHRKAHVVGMREAVAWSVVWIALALLFNLYIAWSFGRVPALEYFTAYTIEKFLSIDNIFVFIVIFRFFAVPPILHHRVLFWGILGAVAMRAFFIFAGVALLEAFHWVVYLFGAFLVGTGLKMLVVGDVEVHPERNPLVRLFRRAVPTTADYRGAAFAVREGGRLLATPLLVVLVAVEATDLLFAVDSVPAALAVSRDPFIVFTSNIFAILGLRALYFVLAGAMVRFRHLKTGLALVLVFVGGKMLLADFYKIPIETSLGIVVLLILASAIASVVGPDARKGAPSPKGA